MQAESTFTSAHPPPRLWGPEDEIKGRNRGGERRERKATESCLRTPRHRQPGSISRRPNMCEKQPHFVENIRPSWSTVWLPDHRRESVQPFQRRNVWSPGTVFIKHEIQTILWKEVVGQNRLCKYSFKNKLLMARVATFILIIFKMLCPKMLLPQFFKSVITAIKKKITNSVVFPPKVISFVLY